MPESRAPATEQFETFRGRDVAEALARVRSAFGRDALITSIQHSGSNENPMESVTFAYSKIKVSYNPEQDGSLKGFIDKGFDVLKLKPW